MIATRVETKGFRSYYKHSVTDIKLTRFPVRLHFVLNK